MLVANEWCEYKGIYNRLMLGYLWYRNLENVINLKGVVKRGVFDQKKRGVLLDNWFP